MLLLFILPFLFLILWIFSGNFKAPLLIDFASFVTTVWGGFGESAELVIRMLAGSLVVQEDVTNSWAVTMVRRRIQVSFMKQIALNGLATMKRIQALRQTL